MANNGFSTNGVAARPRSRLVEHDDRRGLSIVPFGELRDRNPHLHTPVVDGLLRTGETCNVIADSKVGKSWLVYSLVLSIVMGWKWLDRFETRRGRALLIDYELHQATLAHRIPLVAKAMGIPAGHYENDLEVLSLRGNLQSLADMAGDLEAIDPNTYQVIVVDAKYRAMTPAQSENDNAAETAFYNTVDRIAENSQSAIVLVHHASKGEQSGKKVTDVGSGAGAQSRATDCHVILRQHEDPGVVVLEAAVRSFAPVEPLALRWEFPLWTPADGIDTSKLKGRRTKADERQADKDREGIDATLTALASGPATARALRRATGFGEYRQNRLLDSIVANGQGVVETKKVGGRVYEEYRLAD